MVNTNLNLSFSRTLVLDQTIKLREEKREMLQNPDLDPGHDPRGGNTTQYNSILISDWSTQKKY